MSDGVQGWGRRGGHTQSERVALPPARHDEELPVGGEDEVARRRGEVVEGADGLGVARDAGLGVFLFFLRFRCRCRRGLLRLRLLLLLLPLRMCRGPRPAVVDVDDAAGAADGDPAVSAELLPPGLPAQAEHGGADRALVLPARDDAPQPSVPLGDLAVLAGDRHALAVAPPREIRDAAAPVDPHLRDPLRRARVQHVDQPAALARRAHQPDVPPAGRQLEPLHRLLLLLAVRRAVDLGHLARLQVPDVEVAPPARREDSVARRRGEGGRVDGRAADVQGGQEGVGRRRLRGDVVQEEGRGWSGGQEQWVARVEGEGVDRGLLTDGVSQWNEQCKRLGSCCNEPADLCRHP